MISISCFSVSVLISELVISIKWRSLSELWAMCDILGVSKDTLYRTGTHQLWKQQIVSEKWERNAVLDRTQTTFKDLAIADIVHTGNNFIRDTDLGI